MKYIFISDVHGQFDKMMIALDKANFNPKTDTLVTLGDLFDRGDNSKEVLEYVMSLPNYIPIWGNHDYRLRQLILGLDYAKPYDESNGVPHTLKSFCNMDKNPSIYWGIQILKSDNACRDTYNKLWNYFDRCGWAIEFPDLIGVHAWLPFHITHGATPSDDRYYLNKEWRTDKNNDWGEAVWANTQNMLMHGCYPDKDMIVGHWSAWRIAYVFGNPVVETDESGSIVKDPTINCSSYIHLFGNNPPVNIIFIDGYSNYEKGGCVNAFVYESDAEPIIYSR